MRNVPIQPCLTSVASATGANALVANINAVAGKQTYIYGIDVSYSSANSFQVVITDGDTPIWSARFNQVLNRDFGPAPLQTTIASSIQAICTTGAANVDARAVLRFTQSSP